MLTIATTTATWNAAACVVCFDAEAVDGRTLRFILTRSALEELEGAHLTRAPDVMAAFAGHLGRIHVAADRAVETGWPSPHLSAYLLTIEDFD